MLHLQKRLYYETMNIFVTVFWTTWAPPIYRPSAACSRSYCGSCSCWSAWQAREWHFLTLQMQTRAWWAGVTSLECRLVAPSSGTSRRPDCPARDQSAPALRASNSTARTSCSWAGVQWADSCLYHECVSICDAILLSTSLYLHK